MARWQVQDSLEAMLPSAGLQDVRAEELRFGFRLSGLDFFQVQGLKFGENFEDYRDTHALLQNFFLRSLLNKGVDEVFSVGFADYYLALSAV